MWALVLHSLWLVLMKLLSSAPAIQAEATEAVGLQFNWIAAYFATLISVAFALPKFIRYFISRYRLDRADAPLSPIFRFHQAPWYYLLTGADFKPEEAPDFIVVPAIVEVGKDAVLYVGMLDEFYVDAEGQLDRVVLESVARRPIAQTRLAWLTPGLPKRVSIL